MCIASKGCYSKFEKKSYFVAFIQHDFYNNLQSTAWNVHLLSGICCKKFMAIWQTRILLFGCPNFSIAQLMQLNNAALSFLFVSKSSASRIFEK